MKKNGKCASMCAERAVKKPISRGLLIVITSLFLVLAIALVALGYLFFSRSFYRWHDDKLRNVITNVESNLDADDLANCISTGVTSEKYDALQEYLNVVVDDFELDYLYIVIPRITVMENVVSATSEAERAAGEEDFPLGMLADWYSAEELARYRSFMDTDGINYFEESSGYGSFYTAVKAIKGPGDVTIALICADISTEYMHGTVRNVLILCVSVVVVILFALGILLMIWLRRKVTTPIHKLEASAKNFAKQSREKKEGEVLHYEPPEIITGNEVQLLGETIEKMAADICKYIDETIAAERRASEVEEENIRLADEAAAAEKIASLSKSLSALLDNMPAMTFYKDVETEKYLACNQAFAEYAGKNSPQEVIGLTDFDLFDYDTARHFTNCDKIALGMDTPYIFFEDVLSANGVATQFQTTKLKFIDATGEMRVLGMCLDVTEMTEIKQKSEETMKAYELAMRERVTYSRIARALSMDYTYIYYIDLESEEFVEYKTDISSEDLLVERRGYDFFNSSREDAKTQLYKDDYLTFINAFTKENVLEKINSTGAFTLTYRLMVNEKPTYVNMKATYLVDDPSHIIIGINNVDVQMRYQEEMERIQEERITYSRVNALSGDYICIYTVDPVTDHYIEYSSTKDYEVLGLAKEGENFFEKSREDGARALYHEDLDRFFAAMNKEYILDEIEKNGFFVLDYRLMISGSPIYVQLKAAMIDEKDGRQIIIGVSNIDAQKRREQEYAYNLLIAQNEANIDALTGVKNKHAYIDVEAKLNQKIDDDAEPVEFALVVFDVNGLKEVNDTLGHQAGDDYIKSACTVICETFKHSPVFRIGGDEFVVIAQGADYENLDALAEKFDKTNRESIKNGSVVIAFGVAKFSGDRNVSTVFEKADEKMYENKRDLKLKDR